MGRRTEGQDPTDQDSEGCSEIATVMGFQRKRAFLIDSYAKTQSSWGE